MPLETIDMLEQALLWIGIDGTPDECDICEDGSVYYGLTQILPRNSVEYQHD